MWAIIAAVIAVAASAGVYYQQRKMEAQAKKQAQEAKAVQISGHDSNRGLYTVYGKALIGSTTVWKKVSDKQTRMTQTGFTTFSRGTGDFINGTRDLKSNRFLYRAVSLCAGPIQSVENILIDDEGYQSSRFGQGDNRHFAASVSLGPTAGQNFSAMRTSYADFNAWGSTFTGKGVAYAIERLYLDNDKPAYQGEPSTKYLVKGRKLYDPRKDSTSSVYDSSLGTSSHRFTTPSTWEWSDNPVLALLDYMTNSEYGRGLALSVIDLESIADSADKCDVLVDIPGRLTNDTGTSYQFYDAESGEVITVQVNDNLPNHRREQGTGSQQKRFRINIAIDPSKELLDNIQEILNVFRGNLSYANGKYRVHMADVASPVLTIGDDDIITGLKISNGDRSQRMNRATIKFINANKQHKTDQVSWPSLDSNEDDGLYDTYLTEDQGEKLHKTFTIKGCTDYYQAQDTAEFLVRDSRSNLTVAGTFGSRCFGLVPGDIVSLTYDSAGYSGKYFRVMQVAIDLTSMNVNLQLKEYDSSVYTWNDARGTEPEGLSWQEEVVNASPTTPVIGTLSSTTRTRADGSTALTLTVPFSNIPEQAQYVDVEWGINGTDQYNSQVVFDTENINQVEVPIERDNATYAVRVRYFIADSAGTLMASTFATDTIAVGNLTGTKLGGIEEGATANNIYQQDDEPTGGTYNDGDIWIDTNDNYKFYLRSGGAWVERSDGRIATALANAASAQSTADGKIVTFYQDAEPTTGSEGDLWIDTDADNKLYRYDGSSWTLARDSGIASAINSAATAQATADGKVTTFYAASTATPTPEGTGDLWYQTDTQLFFRYNGSAWQEVASYNTGALADLDTVGSAQIDDGAVGTDQLASSSVSLSKIIEGSVSKVNPVTQTGNIYRWAGYDDAGNVVNEVPSGITVEYDTTEKALELRCDGNVGMRSDTFKIDHNSIYKITFQVKKDAAVGLWYVGAYQLTSATTGFVSDGGNVQSSANFTLYNNVTRAASSTSNPYFLNDNATTSYVEHTAYLLGSNVDINEVPAQTTSIIQVADGYDHVGLRILNWNNAGTTTSLFIKHLSVVEMTATTIIADNISTTNLAAINSDLGAITAGSLNINNAFIVTSAGVMTATGATISGGSVSGTTTIDGTNASTVKDGAAAGATASQVNRGLALLLNQTTGGTSNSGEASLVGVDKDGNPETGTDGFIIWNGDKITVERNQYGGSYSILTNAASKTGFIVFDVNKTQPFSDVGTAGNDTDVAFVWKIGSQWYYDANNNGNTFTPSSVTGNRTGTDGTTTPRLVALGYMQTGSADTIIKGGLFGEPVDLELASFPTDVIQSGSVGGVTITDTKLYQGTGTHNHTNTGFYLDSSGKFSLKDKLSFDGTTLSIDGNVTVDEFVKAGSGSTAAVMSGRSADNFAFWAGADFDASGGASGGNAPFRVTRAGKVIMTNFALYSTTGQKLFDSTDGLLGLPSTQVAASTGSLVSSVSDELTSGTDYATIQLSSTQTITVDFDYPLNYLFADGTSEANAYGRIASSITVTIQKSTDASTWSTFGSVTFNKTDSSSASTAQYYVQKQTVYLGSEFGGGTLYFASLQPGGAVDDGNVLNGNVSASLATGTHYLRMQVTYSGTSLAPGGTPTTTSARSITLTTSGAGFTVDSSGNVSDGVSTSATTGWVTSNFQSKDSSGNVVISGNLTVNGTTTTLNTATLDVEDKNITLNYGAGDTSASANGAGITIQDAVNASTDATILWDGTNDEFDFSHPISVTGAITATGRFYSTGGSTTTGVIETDDTNQWWIKLADYDLGIYWNTTDNHINIRNTYGDLQYNGNKVWHAGNDNTLFPSAATELSSSQDLDDLGAAQAGFYYQQSNADTTNNNYPSGHAGSLIVQKSAGNATQLYQTYQSDDTRLYFRSDYTTGYGAWQRVFADNYHPNADKWTTARTITLGGDLTGSVSIDGSANATLTAALAWATSDTFTGTYSLVWNASNDLYTASWLQVRGSDDSLLTRNIVADGTISSGAITSSAEVTADAFVTPGSSASNYGVLRIMNPGGADQHSRISSETGAIKITLPQSWTSTMLRMTIQVYEYTTDESFTVMVGGYNYSGSSSWQNTFATTIGSGKVDRTFNVRFAHDGTKCCIFIGELDSTWSYPQVAVTEFTAGFANASEANWKDGWDISFETTSFGTVSRTATYTDISENSRRLTIAGTEIVDTSRNIKNVGSITTSGNVSVGGNFVIDTNTGSQKFQINRIGTSLSHTQALRVHVDDAYAVFTSEQDETNRYGGYMFKGRHNNAELDRLTITAGDHSEVTMYANNGNGAWRWDGTNLRQGINKTAPDYTLDVAGTINGSNYRLGTVEVIDSSRNLTNIGTISSGAISATSVGVTNIVTNKVVKFNGTILDDSNITDTGSAITLNSNTGVGIAPSFRFHAYHPTTNVVARFESGDAEVWIDLHDSNSGSYGALLGHTSTELFKVADSGVNVRMSLDNNGLLDTDAGYSVGGTTVITSARNATFVGLEGNRIGVNNTDSTTKLGIALYGGYGAATNPTYGLLFTGTAGLGTHGNVTADWATYFTMNNTAGRGWIFRNQGDSVNVASISNAGEATFATVTSPVLHINRQNNTASGINWYSTSYKAWTTYMTNPGTNRGPWGNITAPSGTLVTSWALRSFIENAGGYGWTFESGSHTGNPTVVAEIRSSDGSARFGGSVNAVSGYQINGTTVIDSSRNLTNIDQITANDVTVNAGNGHGYGFWGSGVSGSYRIYMAAQSDSADGGRVSGETTSDYNMYFKMQAGTNRGFVFRTANNNYFSINPNGVYSETPYSDPKLYRPYITASGANSGDDQLLTRWRYADADSYYLDLNQRVTSSQLRWAFSVHNNGSSWADRLVFKNGFVGIGGLQDPAYALDVSGSSRFSSTLLTQNYIDSARGMVGGYSTSSGTGSAWGACIWSIGPSWNGSGVGTNYSIGTYGLHWLRNAHPSEINYASEGLYLTRGSASIYAAIGYNGAYFTTDVASTGNITAYYSDERLKDRTGVIENALDKVRSLEGFTYVENELARELGYKNSKEQVGLSAQQVQAVLPHAVSLAPVDFGDRVDGEIVSKSGEDYLTVDYSRLVPLLVESIKELSTEVERLKKLLEKDNGND